jgi:hypothetical protein
MLPALSRSPQHRHEDEHREQKEYADNFQQYLATDPLKWGEEPGNSPADVASGLTRCTAATVRARCDAPLHGRAAALRVFAHDGLSRHTAHHSETNPEYPSNRLRFHFDMMVAAADISSPPRIQRKMPVAGVPLAK